MIKSPLGNITCLLDSLVLMRMELKSHVLEIFTTGEVVIHGICMFDSGVLMMVGMNSRFSSIIKKMQCMKLIAWMMP